MGWAIYAYRRNSNGHCTDMNMWDYSPVLEDKDELAAMMHVAARELLDKHKKRQGHMCIVVDNKYSEPSQAERFVICSKPAREFLWSKVATAKRYVTFVMYTKGGNTVYVTARKGRRK